MNKQRTFEIKHDEEIAIMEEMWAILSQFNHHKARRMLAYLSIRTDERYGEDLPGPESVCAQLK